MNINKKLLFGAIIISLIGSYAFNGYALYDEEKQDKNPEYVEGEVIFKLKDQDHTASVNDIAANIGLVEVKPLFQTPTAQDTTSSMPQLGDIYHAKTGNLSTEEAVERLTQDPNIEYAEPNYIYHPMMVPNDPYYNSSGSWGQDYDDLYGLKAIQCEEAWDVSQGEGIVVAVIDTGVDYNHEDIADNMWINENEIPNNGIDDDGNGFVDDIYGYDFVSWGSNQADPDPMDGHGHGTHCAGTIAATGNNNIGVIGVAPRAKIMAVKGLSDSGSGSTADLVKCIIYAADNDADVLSNSWGGGGKSQVLEDVINYAKSAGCVILASAGNAGMHISNAFPAAYDNVIAIAATEYGNARANFTNWGAEVAVAAPGVGILSLRAENTDMYGNGTHIVDDKYYWANGTSMACPHAAGVAALIIANNPDFSHDEIDYILQKTAGPVVSDEYIGAGIICAEKALSFNTEDLFTGEADIYDPEDNSYLTGRVTISGRAVGKNYVLEVGKGAYPESWVEIGSGLCAGETELGILDALQLEEEEIYALRLTVEDINGILGNAISIIKPDNYWPKKTSGVISASTVLFDLDNDGTDEIVFVSRDDEKVHILKDQGDTFSYLDGWPRETNNIGVLGWPFGLENTPSIGDIDGDGDNEVVIPSVRVLEGEGYLIYAWHHDGSLVDGWPVYGPKSPSMHSHILLEDLNNDGALEVLIGAFAWHGDGSLVDGWPIVYDDYYANYWAKGPAVADIDGDGNREIIIKGFGKGGEQFLSVITASGEIKQKINFLNEGERIFNLVSLADIDKNYPGIEIAANVKNEDTDEWSVYLWHSDGSLVEGWPKINLANQIWAPVAFADINLDGNVEMLVCESEGKGRLFIFSSDGSDLPGWPIETARGFLAPPIIVDIDNDGYMEIIAGSWDSNIYAWHHDGTLMEGWPKNTEKNILSTPAIGDTDGDGFFDLVAGSHNSLYRWNLEGSVDSNIAWPMYQHDARHTGYYTAPPNRAPVIEPIDSKSVNEGQILTFGIIATDPDGDDLTYTVMSLPERAYFNYQTNTFSWTPGYDQAGDYQVTFTATDGEYTDSESITITVNDVIPNRAPKIRSITNTILRVGSTKRFKVKVCDKDNDKIYLKVKVTERPKNIRVKRKKLSRNKWMFTVTALNKKLPVNGIEITAYDRNPNKSDSGLTDQVVINVEVVK